MEKAFRQANKILTNISDGYIPKLIYNEELAFIYPNTNTYITTYKHIRIDITISENKNNIQLQYNKYHIYISLTETLKINKIEHSHYIDTTVISINKFKELFQYNFIPNIEQRKNKIKKLTKRFGS